MSKMPGTKDHLMKFKKTRNRTLKKKEKIGYIPNSNDENDF